MKNKFLKNYTTVWILLFSCGIIAIPTLVVAIVFLSQGEYDLTGILFIFLLVILIIFLCLFILFFRRISVLVLLSNKGIEFMRFGKIIDFIAWEKIENCFMQSRFRLPEILVLEITSRAKIKLSVNKQIVNTIIALCLDEELKNKFEKLNPSKFRWL